VVGFLEMITKIYCLSLLIISGDLMLDNSCDR
jgi:hypothetical protein